MRELNRTPNTILSGASHICSVAPWKLPTMKPKRASEKMVMAKMGIQRTPSFSSIEWMTLRGFFRRWLMMLEKVYSPSMKDFS